MTKKITYLCQECGAAHLQWAGRCEECKAWNSVAAEEILVKKRSSASSKSSSHDTVIANLASPIKNVERIDTQNNEINRVLGGGLIRGSAILIAGEPGIGKSTLLLQLAARISQKELRCLYVSGEESVEQVQMRAVRLNLQNCNLQLISTNSLSEVLASVDKIERLDLLVIDSIQTLKSDDIDSSPGTVSQVKHCSMELITTTKKKNICLVIVGHVTKDGQIAGPKILEHMVDTVIYFEGEHTQQFRIIRAIKNRYGSTNEIGIFEISSEGLSEVLNPSAMLMPSHGMDVSGSCIFAGIEGTRPIMVEIQALVSPSFLATPRRSAVGWDSNRLAMMIAILGTRYGLNLSDKEVYLNVVGGMRVTEPAADLAVIAALISAASNFVIPTTTVFFGEVGLSGEVRQVNHYENRVTEAIKLGLTHVAMPAERKMMACNIERFWVKHITELKKMITKTKGDSGTVI